MKLAQRLLTKYYSVQIKLIGLVSTQKAVERAFVLFCTPYVRKPGKQIPEIFQAAMSISLSLGNLTIRGFRWRPGQSNGKKILLLHGFNSYAYKFENFIQPLLEQGFEVLIFDAPAHGTSDGNMATAILYKDMIVTAEQTFGSFYGFIAHSLGGLSLSLALEKFEAAGKKIVLIAPVTETTRAVSNFFELIPATQKIKKSFDQHIFNLTGKSAAHYSVKRVIRNLNAPVLWIHDKYDRICPYEDIQQLLSSELPHIQFHITERLGHSRIYKEKSVNDRVVSFLRTAH